MGARILKLAVMASVVFAASLATIKTRHDEGHTAHRAVSHQGTADRLDHMIQSRRFFRKPEPTKLQDIPLCETEQCKKQSLKMSEMMNKSVDPCDNFYEYACGGWIAKGLPGDQAKWTIFSYLYKKTEDKLRTLIEAQNNSDNSVGRLVYNWYASCMDQEERNKLKAEPLKELLHLVNGPSLDDWILAPEEDPPLILEDVLAFVHRNLSIFPLFTLSLSNDPRNSSSLTHLSLSPQKPLLKTHDVYLSQERHAQVVTKAYLTLMVRLMILVSGVKHMNLVEAFLKEQLLSKELAEIFAFEVELVKAMQEQQSKQELVYIGNIGGYQTDFPEIFNNGVFDWKRYFNKLTEGLGDKSFSDSEPFWMMSAHYLRNLTSILSKFPRRAVFNYITWNIIYEYGSYLSQDFHDAYMDFSHDVYGIKKSSPLWRRCVRGTDKSLDMGVSMLFINGSGFTNESRQHANDMVQNIRSAFMDNLQDVKWMDRKTKQAAMEKAKAIFQQIGYPDFILNQTQLEQYFAGLQVDPKNFFENRLRESGLRMKNTLLIRGKPLNRLQWDMRPTEINAYYSPNHNKIVVPAGILRPPFYHVEYPHAENFGALGFVVGHELTHGFDTAGARYDKEGNLANWWSNKSLQHFMNREKCLVNEYSQCKVQGHNLSGMKTLGENTADNGGLKLAYMAYQKWLRNKDHDTTLPNLGLTSRQLFFLSFAQIWCEESTPSYALSELATNVHSPGKWRVLVTLKNHPHFAEAFQCKPGTPMNPWKKCQVW
ncbi:unnamed protein product [Porites evermanni]|uniref:Endothelin-converting enzyme 1 n=1 Tax=Porites evermanni TaxID=104178 RepID=A0ABN8MQ46_9CNID|nr:unnamed protein product [Porites evermanni]